MAQTSPYHANSPESPPERRAACTGNKPRCTLCVHLG
jgi:hypothetical protein